MAVQGIATVAAQSPAGALVDATTRKRAVLAVGVVLVAIGSVATVLLPSVLAVFASLVVIGLAGAVLPIAVAAITLGIARRKNLPARIGRNEAFNHAGNVAFAVLAGAIGTYISQASIFYAVGIVSLVTLPCIFGIRAEDIDHQAASGRDSDSASGGTDGRTSTRANWRELRVTGTF